MRNFCSEIRSFSEVCSENISDKFPKMRLRFGATMIIKVCMNCHLTLHSEIIDFCKIIPITMKRVDFKHLNSAHFIARFLL